LQSWRWWLRGVLLVGPPALIKLLLFEGLICNEHFKELMHAGTAMDLLEDAAALLSFVTNRISFPGEVLLASFDEKHLGLIQRPTMDDSNDPGVERADEFMWDASFSHGFFVSNEFFELGCPKRHQLLKQSKDVAFA
jgi:hypothetical protein